MIIDLDANYLAEDLCRIQEKIFEEQSLPDMISWHEWVLIQTMAADIFYEVQRRLREAQPKVDAQMAARNDEIRVRAAERREREEGE
jgi:hypothetical protein